MNDNCLVLGRPYGGCAIIWKRSPTCTRTPIDTNSKRLCAVHVQEYVFEFIIFSVCMPCDNNYDGNSMCDFYDTLGCISSICESSGINSYIIGSDLNTDLSRVNSMHCMAIGEFVENNDLVLCYNTNLSTVDYTFESKINGSMSCVDHVIISHNILDTLMSYDVLHSGCNLSDHSVILAKFAIDFKRTSTCTRVPGNTEQIVWDKVSAHEIHNYKCTLDTSLSNISLPLDALYCTDVFCTSRASSIETFHNDIVNACMSASKSTIPTTSTHTRSRGRIVG